MGGNNSEWGRSGCCGRRGGAGYGSGGCFVRITWLCTTENGRQSEWKKSRKEKR